MKAFAIFPGLLLLGAAANAAETITYTYDARGRLVQVARSGTVNNGVTTSYTIDKADNRTNKTTTGSPNPGPP
jgi:YD repeat-containing protein